MSAALPSRPLVLVFVRLYTFERLLFGMALLRGVCEGERWREGERKARVR